MAGAGAGGSWQREASSSAGGCLATTPRRTPAPPHTLLCLHAVAYRCRPRSPAGRSFEGARHHWRGTHRKPHLKLSTGSRFLAHKLVWKIGCHHIWMKKFLNHIFFSMKRDNDYVRETFQRLGFETKATHRPEPLGQCATLGIFKITYAGNSTVCF